MTGIPDQEIAKYRCILMYDDETVVEAATALRNEKGYDWWHIVTDLRDGGYAVARFSDLAVRIREADETRRSVLLGCCLVDLVGTVLSKVEVVADQEKETLDTVRERAYRTKNGVVVILADGDFKGIIDTQGTRSGPMDVGLVSLAGAYATLPEKGMMSKRRKQAMESKKKKKK
ncbi:MAG: hypothetical protein JXB07_00420 [Anaerolineae bacterium]|nr:hypothetical protein [Anaerolineae bacterium]